jgi:integration host factor subunit alpha
MRFSRRLVALVRGEPVKLRSFGKFHVRSKRERVGRNPKTGAEAKVTPRRVLTFKASPVLAARINGEIIDDEEE